MSFTKNDRKLQSNSGKTFPTAGTPILDSLSFRTAIADALRRDFGAAPASVKRVARLIGANERGVRNWFDASNGPSGEHLVALMRHSPATLQTVLVLAGQVGLVQAQLVSDAKDKLRQLFVMLDELTAG